MSGNNNTSNDESVKRFLEKGTLPDLDVDWLISGKHSQKQSALKEVNNPPIVTNGTNSNVMETSTLNTKNVSANIPKQSINNDQISIRKVKSYSVDSSSATGLRKLTRSSSVSTGKQEEKKHGFFSSLFRSPKKHDELKTQRTPSESGLNVTRAATTSNATTYNKNQHLPNINTYSNFGSSNNSNCADYRNSDNKKLEEFIQYYKQNGFSASSFINKQNATTKETVTKKVIKGNDNDKIDNEEFPSFYDALGRPIPAHPSRSKFPPAIKQSTLNNSESISVTDQEMNKQNIEGKKINSLPSNSHRFGTFLSRVTSHGGSSATNSSLSLASSHSKQDTMRSKTSTTPVINEINDVNGKTVVPGLEDVKPLKYVAFSQNTYFNDPPQQICSRKPREGEVEVKSNGSVIIHRLTPDERRKVLESTTAGIVIGGSGRLHLISEDEDQGNQTNEIENKSDNNTNASLIGSSNTEEEATTTSHGIESEEAIKKAAERAKFISDDSDNEEEVGISDTASKIKVDKQLIHSAGSHPVELSYDEVDDTPYPPKDIKIPHDVVYTRCCHLREILPIPATMKQLQKGSTSPIPILKLRNPHPSMIEILSFSDFIRAVPIIWLSLDAVHLSVEMLKILLSSIINNPSMVKLSLRNTPLDSEGWKIVCYFVSNCKTLKSIDLSMAPSIIASAQKLKNNSVKQSVTRMKYNPDNRSELNWDLLTAAIASLGGLEEIIISGAQMNLSQFSNFIEVACIGTERLGLAFNKLTNEQCDLLSKWLVRFNVTGLDVGFNDLRGKLSSFSDAIWNKIQKSSSQDVMSYISFNGTNLEVPEGATSCDNEVLKLMTVLCYCENLQFLDLSNNPKIFPCCTRTLIKCLPVFADLVRLHLDYNEMNDTEIIMLADVLPLCSKLNYFSMLGSKLEIFTYKTLIEAVRKSNSLMTLNVESEGMSDELKNELSILIMKNVQTQFKDFKKPDDKKDSLMNLQEELSKILTENGKNNPNYEKQIEDFISYLNSSRSTITKVIGDLFDLQAKGELNIEGKETLIRLCFTDDCLEKGVRLLKSKSKKFQSGSVEPDTSHISQSHQDNLYTSRPDARRVVSRFIHMGNDNPQTTYTKEDIQEFHPERESSLEKSTRTNMQTNNKVTSQTREEGNIFRKSAQLNSQVEDECKDVIGEPLGNHSNEPVDSDMIKDLLLKNDISNTVDIIDELHKHGYHLHEIFRKAPGTRFDSSTHYIASNNIPKKEGTTVNNKNSDPSEDPSILNSEDQKAIDAAYDNVLDQFKMGK